MHRTRRKRVPGARHDTIGAPAGTLVPHPDAIPSTASLMAYGPETVVEEEEFTLARLGAVRGKHPVTWINVTGLGDVDLLSALGKDLGLHRLALEDVLNVPQRPKVDAYDDHQYITVRMPVSKDTLLTEQVSIFLGKDFVLTVQERPGDCFDAVRTRIREGRHGVRAHGPDYLAYALMDAIVDSYFPLLEFVATQLDELELAITERPEKRLVARLHDLKHSLVILRRYVEPLRELTMALTRAENPFLTPRTRIYMRDCLDHSRQAFDLVESYREVASGLMDLYLSMVGHRMNEVMKVLTIIATVFIPLSFIAGVYGMNFDPRASGWNMPELGWPFGYPLVLGVMALCALAMLTYFWRKGWFR